MKHGDTNIDLTFNFILFNVVPDKGYVLDLNLYNSTDDLLQTWSFLNKTLSDLTTNEMKYLNYASNIQQFQAPYFVDDETTSNFRFTLDLYEYQKDNNNNDITNNSRGKLLDSSETYLALNFGDYDEQ